ncbi:MAG TPA: DUF1616 domain-containing protein [Methanocella sp.]|nr:DUF1616 domain-containing protein [Methanocella sp.]
MASQYPHSAKPRTVTRRLPADWLGGIPQDAVLVTALALAGISAMYLPVIDQSVLRFGLAIVFFAFLPGYAFIAALFTGKEDLGPVERFVLSAGMSLVISPLIGFGLDLTPLGVRPLPAALGVGGFTVLFTLLSLARRSARPADLRFSLDLAKPALAAWDAMWPGNKDGSDRTATALLLAALALVAITLAALALAPAPTGGYTELYLYGNNSTIAGYPQHFTLGETKPVTVGIANHEGRDVSYVLAVTIGDEQERQEIYRENVLLAQGQTLEKAINLTPDVTGISLDMQFLLYADGQTDEPYRSCNLWVEVDPVINGTEFDRRT